ncbi:hypothetical protein [Thermococcus sp.]|uniref:hypothetical protein n=1 Tax=Thermococcus sp. TaxID=35749 RepID=UPI00262ED515|nr:hypothetical protein [Thermococcus sp.]
MLKRVTLLVLLLLFVAGLVKGSVIIWAPGNGTITYPNPIAGVGADGKNGFVIVVPFNMTSTGKPVVPGAWVVYLKSNGSVNWVEAVKGDFLHSPRILYATANGSTLLIGRDWNGNHTDLWVVELSENGTLVWSKDYLLNVSPGWIPFVDDAVQTGDRILITTHVEYDINGIDVSKPLVLALDRRSGEVLWARDYWIVHGPRELYSVGAGELAKGYYLILHDSGKRYYYARLGSNGEVISVKEFKTNLRGFFVKSTASTGEAIYFLGGSSNGTVLGEIENNAVLWSKLYRLIPIKECTETGQNISLRSVSTSSTEPTRSLILSNGNLFFQPAIIEAFRLDCVGIDTTYEVVKTDTHGNVKSSFVLVGNGTGMESEAFVAPSGMAVMGNSFISVWRLVALNGSIGTFRDLAIVSSFGDVINGKAFKVYPFKVTVEPAHIHLAPMVIVKSSKVAVKTFKGRVGVKATKGDIPIVIKPLKSLKEKPEGSICGPAVVIPIAFLPLLLRWRNG